MFSEQHRFFLSLSPHMQTRISRFWKLLCLTALVNWKKNATFITHLIPYFYLTPRNTSKILKNCLWGSHSSKARTRLIQTHNSALENRTGLTKGIWWPGSVGLCFLSPALAVAPGPCWGWGEAAPQCPSRAGQAARGEREQELSREQTLCVLRQPPSELRQESRAPRKFREFSQRMELHCKYRAETVPDFARGAEGLGLSKGSSRTKGCFNYWAVRQDLSSLCDSRR